jgi:urea transporter
MAKMQIMKTSGWIGIALILSIGIIHLSMYGEEYAEAPYLGIMFLGAFIGSIIAAMKIYRQELWGWGIGALIALGSILGYLLSRTIGLPISGIEPWGPATGYVSVVVEILFVVLSARLPGFQKLIRRASSRPDRLNRSVSSVRRSSN